MAPPPWVILSRVPRLVLGDAPADGDEGGQAELDAGMHKALVIEEVVADEQAEGVAEGHEAGKVEFPEEVEANEQAEGVAEGHEADAEAYKYEKVEADEQAADPEAYKVEFSEEVEADEQADFYIPVADPPRIAVISVARTVHPDKRPYVVAVDSDCILFNFGVAPSIVGVCFDDVCDLILARHFDYAGVRQGRPIMATAARIPSRDAIHANVTNLESIGIISSDEEPYIIVELMVHNGLGIALLVKFCEGSKDWVQESAANPLPGRDGEWAPSGVVSHKKKLWWFDLSWGIISYNPFLDTDDGEPLLLFHQLPEGRALSKAQTDIHDRRCIAESVGSLRYVEIIPMGEGATVSMWTRIAAAEGNEETIGWDKEYEVSFAEIWDDESYRDTGMPRKVPVLASVCPSDANLIYFALEDEQRLFGVNVCKHKVEEFVDEPYELVTLPRPARPSCRYVFPWFLPPPQVPQGMLQEEDLLCREVLFDYEELQEGEIEDHEQQVAEMDLEEQSEPEIDYDPLAAVVHPGAAVVHDRELPVLDTEDSELPEDASRSSEEGTSVSMDPATITWLKSEVKRFAKEHEGSQSQDPGPGDDAGKGAS